MENGTKAKTERSRQDLDRLIFLSDGVFAIAITLLILDVKLPQDVPYKVVGQHLTEALTDLLTGDILIFIYSFIVIGFFWISHRHIFHWISSYDNALTWLNILFLMCIAFTPFPTSVLNLYPENQSAVVFYAGSMTLTGLMLCILWFYPSWNNRFLKENIAPVVIRHHNFAALLTFFLFLISLGIAFIPRGIDFAKVFWILIPISLIINRRLHHDVD